MAYDFDEIESAVSIREYPLDSEIHGFDCGKPGMNEFVNGDEVRAFHRRRLGRTRVVDWQGKLAAYFTLAPNALTRDEYEGEETEYAERLYDKLPEIPARLLGRIAVDERFQGRGLGGFLVDRILAETLRADDAFRIVLLHAHQDVVGFYEGLGFVLSEIGLNSNRENKIMFFDLGPIGDDGPDWQ